MGSSQSSNKKNVADDGIETVSFSLLLFFFFCNQTKPKSVTCTGSFNPEYITFTESGNLKIHNNDADKDQQLKEFAKVDSIEEVEGKEWYIMDSAWVNCWLAYVHFDKVSYAR